MKEEVLINLGFERNDVSEEESGDKAFYYFTMDFGDVCLISNSNDEAKEDGWRVELFDTRSFEFKDEEDLRVLINIFKRSLKDDK
jgi:hypothetical protein